MSRDELPQTNEAVEHLAGRARPAAGRARWRKVATRVGFVALVAATAASGATFGATVLSNSGSESSGPEVHDHDEHDHDHEGDDAQEPSEGLLPPPVAYADVEHRCVVAGSQQTLEVETDPRDQVRYRTRFSEAEDLDNEGPGSGEGSADDEGLFTATFTVPGDAPEDGAVIAVFVRDADGGFRGSTHAAFDVVASADACPAPEAAR